MTSINRLAITVVIATASSLITSTTFGAGFALIENSASGQGNAFAGGAAIADDPSTVYFNPAGMSRLNTRELSIVGHVISTKSDFTNNGSTTAAGEPLTGPNSGAGTTSIVPNLYYVHPLNKSFTLGLGINVPFGLTTEYDDDWVGRYHGVKSSVSSINVNPSLAWKANDKLSLGAGVSMQYIDVELTSAVDFGSICSAQEAGGVLPPGSCAAMGANPQQMDGFAELQADDISWGFNFGVLYEFTRQTRAGLSYRSKVKQVLDGDAKFTVPGEMAFVKATNVFVNTGIKSDLTLPESVSLSVYHEFSDKIAVMADWTWTHWSDFEELKIEYDSSQPDSVTTENWNDSSRYSLGINYQLSQLLMLRGGLAYDQTPIPDAEHRTPRLPTNNRTWVSFGVGYDFTKSVSMDLGYSHLFISDGKSDNTYESGIPTINHTLKGEYESAVNIFSAQLNWKFL